MEATGWYDIELLYPLSYLDPFTREPLPRGKFMACFVRLASSLRADAAVVSP